MVLYWSHPEGGNLVGCRCGFVGLRGIDRATATLTVDAEQCHCYRGRGPPSRTSSCAAEQLGSSQLGVDGCRFPDVTMP